MNINKNIIEQLNKEVEESIKLDEIPIGAVVFKSDDQSIIASGHNTRQSDHNVLGHAEVNAILAAEKKINDWRLDGYSMIVSLKPCEMCSTVIKESRLDRIYYILNSNYIGVVNNDDFVKVDYFPEEEKMYDEYLKNFFHKKR